MSLQVTTTDQFNLFLVRDTTKAEDNSKPKRELKTPEVKFPLSTIRDVCNRVLVELEKLTKKQLILGNLTYETIAPDKDNQIPTDFTKTYTAKSLPADFSPPLPYMSPEVASANKPFTSAVDMWSLGCTLYCMYTGKHRFEVENVSILKEKQISAIGVLPLEILPSGIRTSLEVKYFADLIMQMLEYTPNERITPELALNHPFICGEYKYDKQTSIGSGNYSTVHKAKALNGTTQVALKICQEYDLLNNKLALAKEAKIIKHLNKAAGENNHHIVRLHTDFKEFDSVTNILERVYLALELYTGNTLQVKLLLNGSFSLDRIQNMGKQLLVALSFLKKQKVLHADFKENNIMFRDDKTDELVVLDFGLSLVEGDALPFHTLTQRFSRSPEVYLRIRPYTPAIDMWALGCILYKMFTSKTLFAAGPSFCADSLHAKHIEVLGKYPEEFVVQAKYEKKRNQIKSCQTSQTTSLKKLITSDKYDQEHLASFVDLLEKILVYDPKKRLTPEEALNHSFFKRENPSSERPLEREVKLVYFV